MKINNMITKVLTLAVIITMAACSELDVKNPNNPDSNQVLGDPDQYPGVIGGAWNQWYYVESGVGAFTLAAIADQLSGSMNNFNINLYSSEPNGRRNGIDNSPTAANNEVVNEGWDGAYSSIGGVLDVLRILKENPDTKITDSDGNDITQVVVANSYLLLGLNYGYLSEVYDRAFLIDENVEDPTAMEFPAEPNYKEVLAFALSKLDAAIAILDNSTFTIPSGWLNTPTILTSEQLSKIAHSYAARFIALNARTVAENEATDWAKVKSYAENGITEDFMIISTGFGTNWVHQYSIYATSSGWGRVDQRIVSLFDAGQPSNYPLDGTTNLGAVNTDDERINTDFQFIATQWANPERGYWHFSNYRYKRLDPIGSTYLGPHPFMRKAENDLLLAEAIIMTSGPNNTSAELINNSRVGRGQLTPLTGAESKSASLQYVFYERDIELFLTGSAISFADERRRDMIKAGSPIQMPVPGKELELLIQPIYTYPNN